MGQVLEWHLSKDAHRLGTTQELLFPSFNYYLDESDPDIVILRRQDNSFAAAFSAQGATKEGVIDAANEDYRELVRDHSAWRG